MGFNASRLIMGFIRLLRFCASVSALIGTGCSPLGLFGPAQDQTLSGPSGTREIPLDCQRLDLSAVHLSASNFRQVLACVNKTGTLTPLLQWVDSTPREDLEVLLRAVDRAFLKDADRRKAWTRATLELRELGLLREGFERISADRFFVERWSSRVGVARELIEGSAEDLSWLKGLLSAVALRWSAENFEKDRDAFLSILEAPVSRSFQSRLSAAGSAQILGQLLRADRENADAEPRSDWISVLLRMSADGGLGRVFRSPRLMGTESGEWNLKVPALARFQNELFEKQAELFRSFAALYRSFSTTQKCWKDSQEIKDGPKKITIELLDHVGRSNARKFVQRDTVLSTVWLNGFCEFPAELHTHYPRSVKFADSPSLGISWDVLKSIQEAGHLDTTLDFLTSPRSHTFADLFAQMGALDLFGDSILMLLLPRAQDDALYAEWAGLLSGEQVYPGLRKALSKVSGETWARWLAVPLGEEAWLRTLRRSYYSGSGERHPYLEIFRDGMKEIAENPEALRVWLKHSQKKEFQAALQWLHQAAGNGQAESLLVFFSQVFGDPTTNIPSARPSRRDPPMRVERSHDWSARDLGSPAPADDGQGRIAEACQKLDLKFHLAALDRADFDLQLSHYLACVDSDGVYARFADGVRALRKIQVDGKSLYAIGLDRVRQFNARATPAQALELSALFIPALGDGRIGEWIKIFARAFGDRPEQGIAAPLLELAPAFRDLEPQLREAQSAVSRFFAREEFPLLVAGARQVWNAMDRPLPTLPRNGLPIQRDALIRAVLKNECELPPSRAGARADELIREHEQTITNLDTVNGKPRSSWGKGELEAHVLPLLSRFSDPLQNRANVTLLQSLLNLLKSFSREPGEAPTIAKRYTPEEMRDWVLTKSSDLRVIPYFYPEDQKPRARIISVLDALEMILLNSDITDFRGEHYGVRFLMMLAESWGDEPRHLWPLEIQEKYPARRSKRPPKLSETLDDIERLLTWVSRVAGDPRLPNCFKAPLLPVLEESEEHFLGAKLDGYRKGLFNNRQILPIIRETMPDSAGPHRGGFKILRDLFWALHISTPEEFRSSKAGERNNMHALLNLVRAGLLRQVSRLAVRVPKDDPRVEHAGDALLGIALAPEMERVIRQLIENPARKGFASMWTRKLIEIAGTGDVRADRLATLGTYGVLGISKLRLDGEKRPREWPRALGRALEAALREFSPGLFPDPRWLDDLVATDFAAQAAVALYENDHSEAWSAWTRLTHEELSRTEIWSGLSQAARQLDTDSLSRRSLRELELRLRAFLKDPILEGWDWRRKIDTVLAYLEDEPRSTAKSARAVRMTLSELMAPGPGAFPQQCIAAAAAHPEELYGLLSGLSEIASAGELEEMLARAWRNLTPASAR